MLLLRLDVTETTDALSLLLLLGQFMIDELLPAVEPPVPVPPAAFTDGKRQMLDDDAYDDEQQRQ